MSSETDMGQLIEKEFATSRISGFTQALDGMCHGMCLHWIRRIFRNFRSQKVKGGTPSYLDGDPGSPGNFGRILEAQQKYERRTQKIGGIQAVAQQFMTGEFSGSEEDVKQRAGAYGAFCSEYHKTQDQLNKGKVSFTEIVGSLMSNPFQFMKQPSSADENERGVDWEKVKEHVRTCKVGRCYVIGCQGGKPHAVAIFKEMDKVYRLMEPNFGEFLFAEENGEDNLLECLEVLFGQYYQATLVTIDEFYLPTG